MRSYSARTVSATTQTEDFVIHALYAVQLSFEEYEELKASSDNSASLTLSDGSQTVGMRDPALTETSVHGVTVVYRGVSS